MSNKLVTIATFTNPVEADLLASQLRSYGIYCFIINENTARMNIFLSMAASGVKVQVRETDLELTREILNGEDSGKKDGNFPTFKLGVWIYIVISILVGVFIFIIGRRI